MSRDATNAIEADLCQDEEPCVRKADGNSNQRRFRSTGNGQFFDNSLNIEGLRLKGRMENGYEKGCTRGSEKNANKSVSFLRRVTMRFISKAWHNWTASPGIP